MTTTDPGYTPSARELVADELAKREAQFATWYLVDRDDVTPLSDEAAVIRAKAQELGWDPPGIDDDASDEENAESELESATEHLRAMRDEENAMDEDVLGVSVAVTVTLRVELSTGGPGDYLTAELDLSDCSVSDVTYHYVPWFDHASVPVDSGSPLYRLVEHYASAYEGQTVEEVANR